MPDCTRKILQCLTHFGDRISDTRDDCTRRVWLRVVRRPVVIYRPRVGGIRGRGRLDAWFV